MSRFLCVGMGKTNMSLSIAIVKNGGEVIAVDDSKSEDIKNFAKDLDIQYYCQPERSYLKKLAESCDYCVPTPGLPDSHPVFSAVRKARKKGARVELMSELDYAASLVKVPIVAITGTNGKSSVVNMVTEALKASGLKAESAGNTEIPFSRAVYDYPDSEIFVIEASSFGLRNARQFSPQISAWLNFTPNHLDRHSSLAAYEKSKARIWERVLEGHHWVANAADPVVMRNVPNTGFAHYFGTEEFGIEKDFTAQYSFPKSINAQAAYKISTAAGASAEAAENSIANFKGLPHRMELLADKNGVKWYNDSKATTPYAVKAGISSFDSVILIAGGRDKSGSISELCELKNLKALIAFGESAEELMLCARDKLPAGKAENVGAAALMAYGFSEENDSVIFSPGGSSHDSYSSYVERGEAFRTSVEELLEGQI